MRKLLPERPMIRLIGAVILSSIGTWVTIDSNSVVWGDIAIPFLKLGTIWLIVDEVVVRFRLAIARYERQRREGEETPQEGAP